MLSRLMTVREQMILGGFAASLVVGSAALFWHQRVTAPAPATPEPPPAEESLEAPVLAEIPLDTPILPEPLPEAPAPVAKIGVAAMGAVNREGLYYLPEGSRVGDLLKMAGGVADDGDLSSINLAAPLIDGTTLTVPRPAAREGDKRRLVLRGTREETPNPAAYLRGYAPSAMTGPAAAAMGVSAPVSSGGTGAGLINLNTATQAELETLPGIGPSLAQRIIAYRKESPFTSVDELDEVSGIGPKRMETLKPLVCVQ